MIDFNLDFEKYLNLYLDGRLEESARAEFEKFLGQNPEKAQELHRYQSLNSSARKPKLPELPDGYWDGLHSRIQSRIAQIEKKQTFWRRAIFRIKGYLLTVHPGFRYAGVALTLLAVVLISRHFVLERKITDLAQTEQTLSLSQPQGSRSQTYGQSAQTTSGDTEPTKTDLLKKDSISSHFAKMVIAPSTSEIDQSKEAKEASQQTIENRSDSSKAYRTIVLNNVPDTVAVELEDESHAMAPVDVIKKDNIQAYKPAMIRLVPTDFTQSPSIKPESLNTQGTPIWEIKKDSSGSPYEYLSATPPANEKIIEAEEGPARTSEDSEIPVRTPIRTELPLDKYPLLSSEEFGFQKSAAANSKPITSHESITLDAIKTIKLVTADDSLRFQGDSLLAGYEREIFPNQKAFLLLKIVEQWVAVAKASRSQGDIEKCRKLIKITTDLELLRPSQAQAYLKSLDLPEPK